VILSDILKEVGKGQLMLDYWPVLAQIWRATILAAFPLSVTV
jgi:hypothetical protein